jgi:hypothetical protein
MSLKYAKNYYAWTHRVWVVSRLLDRHPEPSQSTDPTVWNVIIQERQFAQQWCANHITDNCGLHYFRQLLLIETSLLLGVRASTPQQFQQCLDLQDHAAASAQIRTSVALQWLEAVQVGLGYLAQAPACEALSLHTAHCLRIALKMSTAPDVQAHCDLAAQLITTWLDMTTQVKYLHSELDSLLKQCEAAHRQP